MIDKKHYILVGQSLYNTVDPLRAYHGSGDAG